MVAMNGKVRIEKVVIGCSVYLYLLSMRGILEVIIWEFICRDLDETGKSI